MIVLRSDYCLGRMGGFLLLNTDIKALSPACNTVEYDLQEFPAASVLSGQRALLWMIDLYKSGYDPCEP